MAAQNIDIPDRFDPRTTTLEDFIKLYKNVEGAGKDFGKKFETRKDLQPLLKRPVIELLSEDMIQNPDSPLNKGIKNAPSEGMKQVIRGSLRGVERNVFRMMDAYGISREGYLSPSTQVVVKAGTGTGKKTDTIRFNPQKLGAWYVEAEKFIEKNPAKAPAVLAFMYALQTGFRPEEVLQTDARHLVKPEDGSNRLGVFMTPKNMQKKTGNVMNAPLSPHAAGIIALQTNLNDAMPGDTPFIFSIVDEKTGKVRRLTTTDVNEVIRQIKVPGILVDISGETPTNLDTFQEMRDARRMNSTLYDFIGVPQASAAMLKGRDVKVAGGGREATYIGPAPGVYGQSTADVDKFSGFIQNSYEQAGGTYTLTAGLDSPIMGAVGLDTTQPVKPIILSQPLEIIPYDEDAPAPVAEEEVKTEMSEKSKKGFAAFANRGIKTGLAIGGVGLVGASLFPRVAEAQEKIERGEPVVPSVLEEAGQFILEEGPIGTVQAGLEVGEMAVGAALEPVAEEIEQQAGEAGLQDDIEGQMSRMFGIQ